MMPVLGVAVACVVLLLPDTAAAFRCKNKLFRDGMHEQEVIAICGQPATRRHIGYAVRDFAYGWDTAGIRGHRRYAPVSTLSEEVVITEYVYNFGPRKLMRRLLFEGGMLVEIETLGYGYIEKDADE